MNVSQGKASKLTRGTTTVAPAEGGGTPRAFYYMRSEGVCKGESFLTLPLILFLFSIFVTKNRKSKKKAKAKSKNDQK